ncbi:methyl-accepting chemotaxis protein [Candidatus Riflebacteria bacterium]
MPEKKSSLNLKIILGVVLPLIFVFILGISIIDNMLDKEVANLFNADIIPLFTGQVEEMEKKVAKIIAAKVVLDGKNFEKSFQTRLQSLTDSLAMNSLQYAEVFDFDSIEELMTDTMSNNKNIGLIKFYTTKDLEQETIMGEMPAGETLVADKEVSKDLTYVKAVIYTSNTPLLQQIKSEEKQLGAVLNSIKKSKELTLEKMQKESKIVHEDILNRFTTKLFGTFTVTVILLVFGLYIFLKRVVIDPIKMTVSAVEKVALGDLKAAEDCARASKKSFSGKDETGQLVDAIQTMTHDLNSLVSQVQKSGIILTSTATEIASAAKELEATATEQLASTNEVGATAKQISATSRELVSTMNGVSDVASETEILAGSGREGLDIMQGTMQKFVAATGSISSRFTTIKDRADDINTVVTTITKVADQTNLLSLNAAIEAEKAGEFGLGFAVVAREIRRLADQTAVATLDIEQMVQEMHLAVTEGIDEMGEFTGAVKRGVENVIKISSQLEKIIERVQVLTPKISEVNEGVIAQSTGAQQISDAMSQLTEGASQTSLNLQEFNKATGQLNAAARDLQKEVSKFRVKSS